MDDLGSEIVSDVRQLVALNKNKFRLVFDNFDFKILANIVLKNHRNSDMHWMTQFGTFDRVSSCGLDNTMPLVSNINNFENKEYLLSDSELRKLKTDFTVLVARVLIEFFTCLQYLQKHVCQHIPHRYIYVIRVQT